MILNPISLADYFINMGFFQPVLYSFAVLGVSLLVQKLVFGGVDDV